MKWLTRHLKYFHLNCDILGLKYWVKHVTVSYSGGVLFFRYLREMGKFGVKSRSNVCKREGAITRRGIYCNDTSQISRRVQRPARAWVIIVSYTRLNTGRHTHTSTRYRLVLFVRGGEGKEKWERRWPARRRTSYVSLACGAISWQKTPTRTCMKWMKHAE